MDTFKIKCEKAIPTQTGGRYKGITFDGCYFYLTCPDALKVIKYDICFEEISCYTTQKPYASICYDCDDDCFFATCGNQNCKIFKLDTCFREIDCITLHPPCGCGNVITGISYDCNNAHLIASFPSCIVTFCKDNPSESETILKCCCKYNTDVLAISPSFIVTTYKDYEQKISFYDCKDELKCTFKLPAGYFAESIVFYPCKCNCNYCFYILSTKNGNYPYILECYLSTDEINIGNCNYSICDKNCKRKQSNKTACNDIIESVALIETALSHILNAEGEKLQKVIATTDDVAELLSVNASVNKMVKDVTHLEIILHDKLSLLEIICENTSGCTPCTPCTPCSGCTPSSSCTPSSGCTPSSSCTHCDNECS